MLASLLIIEDHPLYCDGLVQLLSESALFKGWQLLTAQRGEKGLALARSAADLRLILLDPGLPGMHGAQIVGLFCKSYPEVPVVALSANEDRRAAQAAVHAGACAFVSKEVSSGQLLHILGQALSGTLIKGAWVTSSGTSTEPASESLTPRQQEVLIMLCKGHSNKEIGLRLQLAEVTVKMHVSAIFRILRVTTRTQAVAATHSLGLDYLCPKTAPMA